MNLAELDDYVASTGLPVRSETLADAWELADATAFGAIPAGQVLALITMRVRPGLEGTFRHAVDDFIEATSRLSGALKSTLHRSMLEPSTWFLMERFASDAAFDQHMASLYFRTFQEAAASLLVEPMRPTFLARGL